MSPCFEFNKLINSHKFNLNSYLISDVSGKLDAHFVCNICNKICGSQAQLIIHQHSHKHACPICPETFTKKELL